MDRYTTTLARPISQQFVSKPILPFNIHMKQNSWKKRRFTGDMYKIAVRWTEYAPRLVEIHPELFSEMKGKHRCIILRMLLSSIFFIS